MKKGILFLCAMLAFVPLFAQENTEEPASVELNDSDMKNFIKNYQKISKELDKMNVEMDAMKNEESDLEKVEALEKLFKKYGISGPSAFAKVILIHNDYAIEHYDRGINSDPITRAIVKKAYQGSDPFAELRDCLNKDDYAIVKKYYKELCELFGNEPFAEAKASKSGSKDKKQAKADSEDSEEKEDEDFWTDEDNDELKEAIGEGVKSAIKEEAKRKAKEDTKNLLKNGARSLLPF